MPIYEYRCEHCGVFEEMQRITDPPLSRCPSCHRKVRRLISSTSFQLKGTGWYVTDYARSANGGKKDATGDKSDAKAEAKSDSTSSDSKPAGTASASTKPAEKSAS